MFQLDKTRRTTGYIPFKAKQITILDNGKSLYFMAIRLLIFVPKFWATQLEMMSTWVKFVRKATGNSKSACKKWTKVEIKAWDSFAASHVFEGITHFTTFWDCANTITWKSRLGKKHSEICPEVNLDKNMKKCLNFVRLSASENISNEPVSAHYIPNHIEFFCTLPISWLLVLFECHPIMKHRWRYRRKMPKA